MAVPIWIALGGGGGGDRYAALEKEVDIKIDGPACKQSFGKSFNSCLTKDPDGTQTCEDTYVASSGSSGSSAAVSSCPSGSQNMRGIACDRKGEAGYCVDERSDRVTVTHWFITFKLDNIQAFLEAHHCTKQAVTDRVTWYTVN